MKTFREVINANGKKAVELTVNLSDYTGDKRDEGLTVSATCWTDDPDVLDTPATFSIDASWQRDGGVGRYDNQHGELDAPIMAIINQIVAKFGGEWHYSPSDCALLQ